MKVYRQLIQGLRTHQANAQSDWREVIYGRLTLNYDKIPQGFKTREAEEGLGMKPSVYYFIGRCDPDFGDSALRFDSTEHRDVNDVPFDTGGVWAGKIVTRPPRTTTSDKASLVHAYSEPHGSREEGFTEWISQNFDPSVDYLVGIEPRVQGFCPDVVTAGRSARHWTWEARVERSRLRESCLRPTDLVMSRRRYENYHGWMLRNDKLSIADKRRHIELLARIYRDPGELIPAQYLNTVGARP